MGMLDDLRNSPVETNYAPGWRWERPGDGVEGTVVAMDSRQSEHHPDGYPIVTVRQDNGEDIAVHCVQTVLKNEVNDRGLRVGDRLAVVYDGKKTSAGGREFHAFRVAHQPGHGAPPPAPAQAAPAPAAAPQAAPGYPAPQQGYSAPSVAPGQFPEEPPF